MSEQGGPPPPASVGSKHNLIQEGGAVQVADELTHRGSLGLLHNSNTGLTTPPLLIHIQPKHEGSLQFISMYNP